MIVLLGRKVNVTEDVNKWYTMTANDDPNVYDVFTEWSDVEKAFALAERGKFNW